MVIEFDIGDWVKIKDEDDYYNIKSIDLDSGYAEVEDISGHTWHTAISTIKGRCTNKEIYGRTEKTTADEYNKEQYSNFGDDEEDKDYGPPYGPHNPTGNEGRK
tara:strand:- start:228 stop:539 length:312 start_codon:yes stop_codon:yes gene_type:complete